MVVSIRLIELMWTENVAWTIKWVLCWEEHYYFRLSRAVSLIAMDAESLGVFSSQLFSGTSSHRDHRRMVCTQCASSCGWSGCCSEKMIWNILHTCEASLLMIIKNNSMKKAYLSSILTSVDVGMFLHIWFLVKSLATEVAWIWSGVAVDEEMCWECAAPLECLPTLMTLK